MEDNRDLFFSVWRNIFLNKYIFEQLNLLKKFKKVTFRRLEDLKHHKYKGYIKKIVYTSDEIINNRNFLVYYDLLESICFTDYSLALVCPSIFPMGIKTIKFPIKHGDYGVIETYGLSLLPNSVTNIKNIYMIEPFISIPSNIKRIHFRKISQNILNKCSDFINKNHNESSLTDIGFYLDPSFGVNLNFDSIPNGMVKRIHLSTINFNVVDIPKSITNLKLDIRNAITLQEKNKFSFSNLKKLELVSKSEIEIHHHILPESLIHLKMISPKIFLGKKSLPNGLLYLKVSNNVMRMVNNNWLPLTLKTLIVGKTMTDNWYGFKHSCLTIQHVNIPPKLVHLEFEEKGFGEGDHQILTPGCIPKSLTYLNVGLNFNQEILKDALPNLVEINLGSRFNQYLEPGVLPKTSLKKLILSTDFNKKLEVGSLPDSITHLIFGYNFNQPIFSLPSSLTCLELYCPKYSHIINTPNLFPPCLSKLVLSNNFKQNNLISNDCFSSIGNVLIE
ncbi:hypothetical protein RB653_006773 [Dictyostelium firmibasis]|uniref:FNIP repeat-containing protein n=1 Tax=Dictyostelium firmibasis TaxID=79012 RepID=A0AAN7U045_9MYCE